VRLRAVIAESLQAIALVWAGAMAVVALGAPVALLVKTALWLAHLFSR
jgi:hypothetical protein